MTTTNLIGGVTNVPETVTMGAFVAPDPSALHVFFNDFDTYAAGDWTIGDVGTSTVALASGDGGILTIETGALDDNHSYFQTAAASFTFEAGKAFWYKARFKLDEVIQSDVLMGLYLIDASPIASAPTDGVWFSKLDGSTTLNAIQAKSGGSVVTTAITTMVADTYVTVGFYYDGASSFKYFLNDVVVGSAAATNLPTVPLAVSFVIQAGEAAEKTLSIDYILAAKERATFPDGGQ